MHQQALHWMFIIQKKFKQTNKKDKHFAYREKDSICVFAEKKILFLQKKTRQNIGQRKVILNYCQYRGKY